MLLAIIHFSIGFDPNITRTWTKVISSIGVGSLLGVFFVELIYFGVGFFVEY